METRVEKRKRMAEERRMKVIRATALCIAVVMMFLIGFSLSGEGTEASYTTKPATVTMVPDTDAEMIRLVATYGAEPQPQEPVRMWTQAEVEVVAKTVYGEAMVTGSDKEMAAVVWCILNRVDSNVYPDSIVEVVTQRSQFHGYHEENPLDPHIKELVEDVFRRWELEKNGGEGVGRVLPAEYLFFWGDGWHNYFTTEFKGGDEWDWSLPNPYET